MTRPLHHHRRLTATLAGVALLCLARLVLPAHADEAEKLKAFAEFAKKQQQQKAEGKTPLGLSDLLALQSADDKRQIIRRMALSNSLAVDIPDKWPLIDEPAVAIPWLRHESEPLDPAVLASLQRCWPKAVGTAEKLPLAAVLYRYGNSEALGYLTALAAGQGDLDATTILAWNREPAALEPSAGLIRQDRAGTDLIYALGSWGDRTTPLLLEAMSRPGISVLDSLRSLSLADRTLDEKSMALVRRRFDSGSEAMRVAAGAVLLRQAGGDDKVRAQEYLIKQVESNTPNAVFAAWALNLSSVEAARPIYRRMAGDYLSTGSSEGFAPLHFEALAGLTNAATAADWQLAVRVLESIPPPVSPSMRPERLGLAAMVWLSGQPDLQRRAVELGGAQFTPGLLAAASSLKRLPQRFLPISSRPIEWRYYLPGSGAGTASL